MSAIKEGWSHQLSEPITLPDGKVLTELKFPRMKGKYMRKFRMRIDQGDIERARAGDEVGSSMSLNYDDYMVIGAYMLSDEHGPITATFIFDEMGPSDIHEVIGKLGERFAGGQRTGETG